MPDKYHEPSRKYRSQGENAIHPTEGLLPLVVIAWSFLYLSPSVAIIVSSIIWAVGPFVTLSYRWQDIALLRSFSLAILSTSVTYWVGGDNKTAIPGGLAHIPALVCYATEFFLSKKEALSRNRSLQLQLSNQRQQR